MTNIPPMNPEDMIAALLACPPESRAELMASWHDWLNLEVIEEFKRYSDAHLTSDPLAADIVTQAALQIAQQLRHESLVLAVAQWARGNWQAYHDPQIAIQLYQQALSTYRAAGDALSVARLLGNLVFAFAECGHFAEAQAMYTEARSVYLPLGASAAFYLLRLEQNYGLLLQNHDLFDAALEVHERALEMALQLNQPIIASEVRVNRGFTLLKLGLLEEAETALLCEYTIVESQGKTLTVARIDMNLGVLYSVQGRPAEALRRLHRARKQFTALENQMEVGTTLMDEAALCERIGALRDALRNYGSAQEVFTARDMPLLVGELLIRRAAVSRAIGRYTQAGRLLTDAEALWSKHHHPLWHTLLVLEQAELALAQEDGDRALHLLETLRLPASGPAFTIQYDLLWATAHALIWTSSGRPAARAVAQSTYERALSAAHQFSDRWRQRRIMAGLGQLALPDDPDTARKHLEAAVAYDDVTRQALSVEELKASFQEQTSDLFPLLIRLAVGQEQPSQALSYTWRAKGSALLDLIHATSAAAESPQDHVELEQVRKQLAVQRWRLAHETPGQQEHLLERTSPEIQTLEQRLAELRRQRNTRMAIGDIALLSDPPILLGQMDTDLLIEYMRCGDDLLAFSADRTGNCRTHWLGAVADSYDLVEELRLKFQTFLSQPTEQRARQHERALAESRRLLQRAYELLIAPLGPLPAEAQLLIAPHETLYQLPFAALWDGQRYLVECHEIQMIPSGSLLTVPPPKANRLGPPLAIAASANGQLAAVQAEVEAVHTALTECVCMVDDPQALDELRDLAVPPRVLHIAAHTVQREDAPLFSALQLAGGLLSVEQCYELSLRGTELVTLSGCATASGLSSGGALLAFQSAFSIAGARQILSSLWPIDDAATATWMGDFYQLLAGGCSPTQALCQTQRALLGDSTYDHPALWAAFMCSRR